MADWTPTDEQVKTAALAIADSEYCSSCNSPLGPCGQCTRDARAALLAVGPAIVAEAETRGAARALDGLIAGAAEEHWEWNQRLRARIGSACVCFGCDVMGRITARAEQIGDDRG